MVGDELTLECLLVYFVGPEVGGEEGRDLSDYVVVALHGGTSACAEVPVPSVYAQAFPVERAVVICGVASAYFLRDGFIQRILVNGLVTFYIGFKRFEPVSVQIACLCRNAISDSVDDVKLCHDRQRVAGGHTVDIRLYSTHPFFGCGLDEAALAV